MNFALNFNRKYMLREEPLYPEKGGKGGGDNGAGAQADAINKQTDLQREQWQTVMGNLAPFAPMAQQYIGQLQGLTVCVIGTYALIATSDAQSSISGVRISPAVSVGGFTTLARARTG